MSAHMDSTLLFVAAVFALAGFVKGVVGLGLPTVSMGLLALVMPPLEAAAVVLLPSFVTNVWQLAAGPALASVARRLWPMMLALCAGTWAGSWAGIGLTGTSGHFGTALLGAAVAAHAAAGLAGARLRLLTALGPLAGPAAGAATGAISAATGVFVVPAVPYLQALGLASEELVQALGLSFTVSTAALAVNVAAEGAIGGAGTTAIATAAVALALACAGMWAGQAVRRRMDAAVFRRWFLLGLLALGLYLFGSAALPRTQ